MQLNKCCNSENLKKIKDIHHSNSDDVILYQCPRCKNYWLYKLLELDWLNNVMLREDEKEIWYICIAEEDLNYVYTCELEKINKYIDFKYISSIYNTDWQKIHDR